MSHKLIHYALTLGLTLSSFVFIGNSAYAQCAAVGSTVTCATDDIDGFSSGVDITDLTVNGGVTVDDSGGDVGGGGIIDIDGNLTGTLLNDGIIDDVLGVTEPGVDVSGNLNNLINNGTITTVVEGVLADSITSLTNNGTITSGLYGVHTIKALGTLVNNGTIKGGFSGVGVYSRMGIGSLTNNGTISGGRGVESSDGVGITTLINNGTITGRSGAGVGSNIAVGTLINTGTITGTGDGVSSTIDTLINSGTIRGGTQGVKSTVLRNLTNTGTITGVNGIGVQFAGPYIVFVTTPVTGSFINSGTIMGGDIGVEGDFMNSLTNSGTITGGNLGISIGDIDSLTNSGKITGGNFAIRETGFANTNTLLTLLPGSDIFGAIELGTDINTLVVGNGLSIDHVFTTALPDIINTNGAPFAIDAGTRRVVVVDTSMLAQQDEVLFDLSQGIWGTVFNNIGGSRNPVASSASGAVPPSEAEYSNKDVHLWASIFGNRRDQAGETPAASARHHLGGLIAGLDGRVNSQWRLGAFFGASGTEIDTNANQQESDVKSIFGGWYASLKADRFTVDLGITGGATKHDNTRKVDNNQVDGLQTLSSKFDGAFIAPELSIRSQLDIGAAGILQPTLRVGYSGMFLDGYTETGSTAPLTVAERDLHILHARFELAMLMSSQWANNFNVNFSPYVGVDGRSLVDGEAVSATLLGQNLSFNPGGEEDVASAFAGVRLALLKAENFGIFAGIEGSIDTEESSTLAGNLGLNWQF